MHDWNDDCPPPWAEQDASEREAPSPEPGAAELVQALERARTSRYLIHFATDEEREEARAKGLLK